MGENDILQEDMIVSWVRLTGILKNTRLTKGMIYNEAIVMLIVHRRYLEDGEGVVSFKEIVGETRMLKSLVNRTISSLVDKGFLERYDGATDRRTTFVRLVPEKLPEYLAVHARTLKLVSRILEVVGEEDAQAFVHISEKISAAFPPDL